MKTLADQMVNWKEKNLEGFKLNRHERRKQAALNRLTQQRKDVEVKDGRRYPR